MREQNNILKHWLHFFWDFGDNFNKTKEPGNWFNLHWQHVFLGL